MAILAVVFIISLTVVFAYESEPSAVCKTTFPEFPDSEYSACKVLPGNGAQFSWTWNKKDLILNAVLTNKVQDSDGWITWGLNHNATDKEATSLLACFQDEAGIAKVQQYLLSDSSASGLKRGGEIRVRSSSCVINGGEIFLKFSIVLRKPAFYQVYGSGSNVVTFMNKVKSEPLYRSFFNVADIGQKEVAYFVESSVHVAAEVNATEEEAKKAKAKRKRKKTKMKNLHGTLAGVGWGVLMPIGTMMARYIKPFSDPAWYYLHGSLQLSGYAIGSAGFAYGIKLIGHKYTHRWLAYAGMILGTLQLLSALIKPQKTSKLRIYWNSFHWLSGYSVIVISIWNIFIGFKILKHYGGWKQAFVIFIIALGTISLVLEITTWVVWISRKRKEREEEDEMEKPKKIDA